ncbi:UDP-N-acetylmuramate dehydrogenase [Desulfoplanes formicivorans]|uniref:UDP-N-acetylenolpyruvoylglucosamine reductase n=1 Tax=Desulfoplanes formicivorans TaxID=1592317 RepID=A0A194AGC0_9BACT|nr:UDP-N-acetylmuramate dehydrogenase [Desulfoplanes formicivorans]GAU07824.1 UDP-N-acetylenolpyruvoylglucosamine reductase [Desulfoplanes formicivorans]
MKITVQPSFRELTTLRLGGQARCLLVPQCDADYEAIPREAERYGGRLLALGRGSNILAGDGEHDLALIRRPCLAAPRVVRTTSNKVLVAVDGGMTLAGLLAWCIKHECSGLEPLAGIPGSIGGAVAMNAGSHGCECFDLLQALRIWTPKDGVVWVDREICRAGYRRFALQGYDGVFAVLEALLAFETCSRDVIRKRVKSWFVRKKSVQPLTAWTAGCAFKNPLNHSAGRLLDQAGLRGYALGGMRFSPVHANFLENTGKGTATQAFELMDLARETVAKRFGMVLEREVEVLECP